ncbi:MAG: hypothetical protein GWP06_17705 [Actinobacteria bacterium]|nr:hypothetical protein [Actinomycetota bacterium]
MVGQCISLGLAVTRRFEALGTNALKFGFGDLYLGPERRIGMQPRNGSSFFFRPARLILFSN